MELVQPIHLGQVDSFQFPIGPRHRIPSPEPRVRVAHPQYTCANLVLEGSDRGNSDTNATCGRFNGLAVQRKNRHTRTVETEFVDVGRVSNWGNVDVAALQWVRTSATKDGFVRDYSLNDSIRLTGSKFVTTQIVGVQKVNFSVLSSCNSYL